MVVIATITVLSLLTLVAFLFRWTKRLVSLSPVVCVGTDVSISHTSAERKRDFGAVLAAVDDVLPFASPMQVWQFDYNARKCFEGQPESSRDLWGLEDKLKIYESHTQGTRPSEALKQMMPVLAEAAQAGRKSIIILVWDGGCETDKPELQKVVAQLAKMQGISAIWLVGVKSDDALRSDTDRIFAPFGSKRLIISGEFDMASGLEKLRTCLREAEEVQP